MTKLGESLVEENRRLRRLLVEGVYNQLQTYKAEIPSLFGPTPSR
jgi:hypothetical protein